MHFTRTLFVGASMVVAALAQTTPIAFTMTPAEIAAGQSYKISWGGGDGTSPVTLTLKQGTPSNLQTVALITGAAGNGSYTWTVPSNLVNGNNYALQISQGLDDVNYSGQFALIGGASSSMTSSSASTTSMPASTSGAIGLAPVVPASLSSILTSLNGTISSAIAAANGSMTGAAASAGTGVAMSRNTTMSMATLPTSGAAAGATSGSSAASSTGSSAPSSTGSSGASGTSGASGSSGAGAAGSSSTTAPKAGAAAGLASPLALVFSAIAAIVYLN